MLQGQERQDFIDKAVRSLPNHLREHAELACEYHPQQAAAGDCARCNSIRNFIVRAFRITCQCPDCLRRT